MSDKNMADEIAVYAREVAKEKTILIAIALLDKIKQVVPFGSTALSVLGPTFVKKLVDNLGVEIYEDIESRVRDFALTKIAERNGIVVDAEVIEFVDKR